MLPLAMNNGVGVILGKLALDIIRDDNWQRGSEGR
jgi:hypothetical protein